MERNYSCTISYGKLCIPVYRVYAHPLVGINAIPESRFTGRANTLFALEIDVEVFGNNFLPAYTEGDNSNVVATDSMKNFVLRQSLAFAGSTIEDLLAILGERFLTTYDQMQRLRLTARELPFAPAQLPGEPAAPAPEESLVLFSRSHSDFTQASMTFARDEQQQPVITSHRCGRTNLELLKVTGSAFTHFVQDEYTTLPEREDRPLFIHLDVSWTYTDVAALTNSDHALYVPAEQVRDLIQVTFDAFVSESIQHLVYELGCRLLERFPQLASVTFDAQNRTRDLVIAAENNGKEKVYSDPFTAFGSIRLTLNRPTAREFRRKRIIHGQKRRERMSGMLTTHVLDTMLGLPAADLQIQLWRLGSQGEQRELLKMTRTNSNGRTEAPLLQGAELLASRYELVFAVGDYFAARQVALPELPFLDTVPIRFGIADASAHYHVPLLVSPWAYSTYRGS